MLLDLSTILPLALHVTRDEGTESKLHELPRLAGLR